MGSDLVQMIVVLALLVAIAIPLGMYMAAVFTFRRTWLDAVLDPIDNAIYRLCGIDRVGMDWRGYVVAMLVTNAVMLVVLLVVMQLQTMLPLNPDGIGAVSLPLAINTAMSFITNTNWQNYAGENTLSYFTQMFAIIFPQFTSAATGLVCGIAFIRGLGGKTDLGNFYVDLTRAITRILLPVSFAAAVVFVGLGIPATFSGAETATSLNGPLIPPAAAAPPNGAASQSVAQAGPSGATSQSVAQAGPSSATGQAIAPAGSSGVVSQPGAPAAPVPSATPTPPSATSQGEQSITRGPVAALTSIKHFGTNGGGWFGVNSAHPFENPNAATNVLEFLLMGSIPVGLIITLGIMLERRRQAMTFFAVMSGFFLVFLAIAYIGETSGNPLLTAIGLDPAQGNMEGKEVRFGQAQTALFVTGTTAFTTGTVDAMHDSLTPLGSITPISQMLLNMVFGGKGVGFINLIIFAILGVFLTGLMVGRTPEFLGKKIEAREVKLASIAFLVHPTLILMGMAITFALNLDLDSISNPGPHGFSEVMYAYTSMAANNGSAFGGLVGNTNWFNLSGFVVMGLGRYVSIVLMLALAGSLAAKRPVPMTIGTMRTDNTVFAGVLAGTVLIIGALTFFPVLALGPIVEHLLMHAGKVM